MIGKGGRALALPPFSFWQFFQLHFELQADGVALIGEVVNYLGE